MKQILAYHTARNLMDKHKLKDWSFGFDNATRRLGVTFHGKKRIQLSKTFVRLNDIEKVTQVILHEVAHALCEPREKHGAAWKAKALEIGCTEAKSTTSAVSAPAKYQTSCPNGHLGYKRRKPRYTTSCGLCSHSYDPKFKITYTLNQEYVEAMKG